MKILKKSILYLAAGALIGCASSGRPPSGRGDWIGAACVERAAYVLWHGAEVELRRAMLSSGRCWGYKRAGLGIVRIRGDLTLIDWRGVQGWTWTRSVLELR